MNKRDKITILEYLNKIRVLNKLRNKEYVNYKGFNDKIVVKK